MMMMMMMMTKKKKKISIMWKKTILLSSVRPSTLVQNFLHELILFLPKRQQKSNLSLFLNKLVNHPFLLSLLLHPQPASVKVKSVVRRRRRMTTSKRTRTRTRTRMRINGCNGNEEEIKSVLSKQGLHSNDNIRTRETRIVLQGKKEFCKKNVRAGNRTRVH